jgi:hypothetical protein
METKKEQKPSENQPVKLAVVKKPEIAIEKPQPIEETPEQLKKQIEELKAKLKEPAGIEERIQYYKEKQELIKRRDLLINQYDEFKEHQAQLTELATSDEFTTDSYNLTLNAKSGYRDDAVVVVKNPLIISEIIEFMMGKMSVKINDLDQKIAC